MSCCCIKRKQKDKASCQIVDVQQVLADYVWQQFVNFNGRFGCFLRRSKFEIEVPMSYLHFETIDQNVTENTRLGDTEGQSTAGKSGSVELTTVFHNGTGSEQTYQFRLEKTRKSTLTVKVQKGFSIGGKAKCSVKLPSGSGGVEFDLKYSVTKTSGEDIEETATFETSSGIKVEENSKCEAKAIMDEIAVDCNFEMKVLVSFVTDGIPITVKRKKDGKVFYYIAIKNLGDAFAPYKSETVDPYPDDEKLAKLGYISGKDNAGFVGDKVLFKIQGSIQGTRLSDQRITLESLPLPPRSDQNRSDSHGEKSGEGDQK